MSTSSAPASNLSDWEQAIQRSLLALPPCPAGKLRLYRVEPTEAKIQAPWLQEALDATDHGRGRWFTDDPAALSFYAQDQAHAAPRLLVMEIEASQAEAWRVRNVLESADGANPLRYSRDPDREFFLPDLSHRHQARAEPLSLTPASNTQALVDQAAATGVMPTSEEMEAALMEDSMATACERAQQMGRPLFARLDARTDELAELSDRARAAIEQRTLEQDTAPATGQPRRPLRP